MPDSSSTQWIAARARFIEAGGNATQSFGFGRVIGQLYALLYLSPHPLCLDDIAAELGVSKASISTTVRQLESLGAARRVWVKGDRKDYYEAETDFKSLLRNGLMDKVRRKLEHAGQHIETVEGAIDRAMKKTGADKRADLEVVAARINRAKKLRQTLDELLNNPLLDHLL
jgi:DNA-binding transcriptional regulator GbsR (MarR family)